jgi:hypothetical protein
MKEIYSHSNARYTMLDLLQKVYRQIHWTTRPFGLGEIISGEYFGSLAWKLRDFDILHFHDLRETISPLTLALCSWLMPVFFTVHDCSAIYLQSDL